MSKKHLRAKLKTFQELRGALIVLGIAIIGTYLLLGSHAASPYGGITAGSGVPGNGANTVQNCVGASLGSCVNFGQALPMDGGVALALNGLGTPFAPSSFWNTPLPSDNSIPANPNNTQYINEIGNELCTGTYNTAPVSGSCTKSDVASLNASNWSSSLYVVPSDQPHVPVINYCGQGDTDQNMTDSNWTTGGWSPTSTTATHVTGNTSPLINTQFEPIPLSTYQVSYTFSGSPADGSTVVVSAGTNTIGSYTFRSSTPGQDNFTVTKVVTMGSGFTGNLTFKPSTDFNGAISAVTVLPYRAAFNALVAGGIPIPADAHGSGETVTPQVDTDREITIYQPSTDKEWEFWEFQKDSKLNSWEACWGGVINNVSQSNGIFPNNTGASATSLPMLGGIPRIEEFQAGQINHVIDLTLPYSFYSTGTSPNQTSPANVTDPGNKAYSWPATRNDGSSPDPLAIPEGQRFRLDPALDLSQYNPSNPNAATPLSPMAYTIAVAAQKYGFVVDDKGGTVAVRLGDPTTYTAAGLPNPYSTGVGVGGVNDGNKGLFDGVAQNAVMAGFPWNHLVALPFNYGEPGS